MIKLKVAANTPFNNSILTYESPEHFKPGTCVEVPLGKRKVLAWVISEDADESLQENKLRIIEQRLDAVLDISQHELDLFLWMSQYYHYPLGQLIADVLPKGMKRPRPSIPVGQSPISILEDLTPMQEIAYKHITAQRSQGFSRHLLHGVTGSGKTHVYLKLMKDTLEHGQSIIFLLPEINLTPQFLEKFSNHLNCPIDVYSSELNASDRYTLRQQLRVGDRARVIIGVRSAVFLPVQNLGLIIVDEEHDASFKQEDRCAYGARDVAIKRAAMLQLPIVLGSATPSMESYCATIGSDQYHPLRERVHGFKMPQIQLIDQRSLGEQGGNEYWPLATKTVEALYQAKQNNEQALVFINRLGFSSYVQCASCGHQFQCLNCSTNMRYFKNRNQLECQTCGNKMEMPKLCPECSCITLTQKGFGTEKVEEVLRAAVAGLRVERFDRDEIKNLDQLKASLERFHDHQVDVLVGTQMLSKGHNFKRVNTVVVLGIDQQLNFPDFRAMERAWQTLVQVSGRSGRFGSDSKVLVQTHTPEHPLFAHVVNHHFDQFYQEERELRERAECPPLFKMAALYMTHKDRNFLTSEAMALEVWLSGLKDHHYPAVDVLGPRPALMEKRVNKFTWCVMLRSSELNQLHGMIGATQSHLANVRGLQLKVDVDPQVIF